MDRSAELLQQRTMDEAESALSIITEALVISPYSEQLLERKAEALFMVCGFFMQPSVICSHFVIFPFYMQEITSLLVRKMLQH